MTTTEASVQVGNRIEVTYSGSHHYSRQGRVTKVHNTRLTVVFENHDGNDGNWIDKDKVLVIMEKPTIPRVYETSSRLRYKHP
jgi:Tfp pilus assembly protein PilP